MIRRPPRSTPFPTRRSSDLAVQVEKFLARYEQLGADISWNAEERRIDRKSTRLNSSHLVISYAVFCLKKKSYNSVRKSYLSSRVRRLSVTQVHFVSICSIAG